MQIERSKHRILIGFSVVIILMVMVAAIGIARMAENNRDMEKIVDENNVKIRLLSEMHGFGRERSILLFKMLIASDPFDSDNDYMKYNSVASNFIKARTALGAMTLNAKERVFFKRQGVLANKAESLQDKVVGLIIKGDVNKARNILIDKAIPAQDAMMGLLGKMLAQEQQSASRALAESRESYQNTVITINILSFVSILSAIMVALFVMRRTDRAENALFTQFEEERKLRMQLTYQASHDALTGLINRFEFEERLRRLLDEARLDKTTHALVYIDLDQFKIVNDTCGHIAGDELLRQLSALLITRVRSDDTLARLGGDEFGLLLEYCDPDYTIDIANALLKSVQEFRFVWGDRNFVIGASIGVVIIDLNSGNMTDVMRAADAACYSAKEAGRNRVYVVREDDELVASHYGEMQWINKINQALDDGRFVLFGQRIIALQNSLERHKDMFEILVRMKDSNGNLVPPGAFIPAAERYNIMISLDHWVIRKVMAWLAAHHNISNLEKCSINVSGSSIGHPGFLDYIKRELKLSGVDPNKICFEITETSAITNLTQATRFIDELKTLGCCFALDDFGCGLSSFAYLKNLQVDYLKIDGMFIRDIVEDPIDRAMVRSINEIGHVMGKKTIAEFVENEAVLALLRSIGVDYVQGFGIEKPKMLELI